MYLKYLGISLRYSCEVVEVRSLSSITYESGFCKIRFADGVKIYREMDDKDYIAFSTNIFSNNAGFHILKNLWIVEDCVFEYGTEAMMQVQTYANTIERKEKEIFAKNKEYEEFN